MLIRARFTLFLILLLPLGLIAATEDSLLSIIAQSDDPEEITELYIKIGDSFEYSEPSKAIEYYRQAYEFATSQSARFRGRILNPELEILRAKSIRYIGIVNSDQGNYEQAMDHFNEALQILEPTRELFTTPYRREVNIKIAKIYNNIGIVYSRQGVFGLAREYYQDALDAYLALEDSTSIAVAYSSMGIVEARQANLPEALKYFQEAHVIYNSRNDVQGIAQSLNNIGGIYYQLGNWEEALELYFQAREAFEKMGYTHRVAAILANIGLTYQNMEDFAKAQEYMQRSLDLRESINDQSGIVDSYNNLGALAAQRGDYSSANDYYSKAYELAVDVGNPRIIALSLINLGKSSAQARELRQAIDYTQQGLALGREHNMKFVVQMALEQLASYYARLRDFENAYQYATEFHSISREILDEQRTKQITELEIEYKAREKQQRIDLLEQQSELDKLKVRQSTALSFVFGLLFFVVLIIAIFTLLLFKQRNKILLLQKEREASSLIRKTDNDLKAILKTHSHAMILFDNELNVVAYNHMAAQWAEQFLNTTLSSAGSFFSTTNNMVNELVNDVLSPVLNGQSENKEKGYLDKSEKNHFYKFFCNPVYDDANQSIQSVSLMIEDISSRRDAEIRMTTDLKEKETLIKEIHHRVKNNMQVIISLIRLQVNEIKGTQEREAFTDLEQRIAAMSYVHEELYTSQNLADINFEHYLKKISSNLVSAYNRNVNVANHLNLDDKLVNIDVAVPCGLIVNELLSNSLKHAFKGSSTLKKGMKPQVDIYFSEDSSGYKLMVCDNGKGIVQIPDTDSITSMGFNLVKIIVEEQLRGTWSMNSEDGLKVSIMFPRK